MKVRIQNTNIKSLLKDSLSPLDEGVLYRLIDFLPVGIAISNMNGNIIYANKQACEMFSETGAEKFTLHTLVGGSISTEERILPATLKHQKSIDNQEISVRTSNGEEKTVLASSVPILDKDDNLIGAVMTIHDITENKYQESKLIENENMIKSLINGITEALALVDLKGNIILANDSLANMLESNEQNIVGLNIFEGMHESLGKFYKEHMSTVINEGVSSHFEDEGQGKNYRHGLSPIFDSTHKVTNVAILIQNITESKRIEKALRDSEVRFRNIFENTASGIALVSLEGHYFLINEALSNAVGYSMEELTNMSIADITHPDDLKEEMKMIEKLINGEIKNYQFEKRYIHKNGNTIWVLLTRSLVRDSNGDPFYTIGQIQNITFQKQVEEELKQAKLEAEVARSKAEKLARTDYLTGLLNRRAFMDRLTEEANRVKRRDSSLAIILTDIDFFKRVNDTYGHNAGDKVLQKFSGCLEGICRPYDFIGRYGGEEFVICLPEVDLKCGKDIAERMRCTVQGMSIEVPDADININITASFGIVVSKIENVKDVEKLIQLADEAMYKAKQEGRNRVVAGVCYS